MTLALLTMTSPPGERMLSPFSFSAMLLALSMLISGEPLALSVPLPFSELVLIVTLPPDTDTGLTSTHGTISGTPFLPSAGRVAGRP